MKSTICFFAAILLGLLAYLGCEGNAPSENPPLDVGGEDGTLDDTALEATDSGPIDTSQDTEAPDTTPPEIETAQDTPEIEEAVEVMDVETDPGEYQCGVGDFVKDAQRDKIYYGTEVPELFNMSPGQQLALGALVTTWGSHASNFCTATLVSPTVVVTAAHCLYDTGDIDTMGFAIGRDASRADAVISIAHAETHPSYRPRSEDASHDVGIVVLSEPATNQVPGIIPIPINRTPLTQNLVGQQVQNGGYGITQSDERNSLRWWVAERLHTISTTEFTVNGEGNGGVCYGDSGGPSIYDFGAGIRVIGVVSWGDPSCVDIDHFANLADNLEWLDNFVEEPADCATLGFEGRCYGNVAQWCDDEGLHEENCTDAGMICNRTAEQVFRCIQDTCQGISFQGMCDEDDVAWWCDNGEVQFKRCAPCQQTCGWVDNQIGYYCVDDPCFGIEYIGCCNGDTAVYCGEGALREVDCAEQNEHCGWVNRRIGYYCAGSGEDPNGNYTLECPDYQ